MQGHDDHEAMRRLEAEVNAIAAEIDAKAAAGAYSVEQYDDLHRYGEAIAKWQRAVSGILARQERNVKETHARLTDLEAARFADRLELEMDLERWQDGIAADVGHDLEEIDDKIMAAIEADRRGEAVGAALHDIHMGVLSVMGDLMAMEPDEEEE